MVVRATPTFPRSYLDVFCGVFSARSNPRSGGGWDVFLLPLPLSDVDFANSRRVSSPRTPEHTTSLTTSRIFYPKNLSPPTINHHSVLLHRLTILLSTTSSAPPNLTDELSVPLPATPANSCSKTPSTDNLEDHTPGVLAVPGLSRQPTVRITLASTQCSIPLSCNSSSVR